MADKGNTDLKLTAGIEGVDEIAKSASKALTPWETGARSAGKAVKDAFTGAISDITRTITVANAISFGSAMADARKFREEIGRLSATDGPVGRLRTEVMALGRAKLLSDQEILSAEKGMGRVVYSFKGARAALGDLQDEALATGETLADKMKIGETVMGAMGVAGGKVGDELGRVRTLADALNMPLLQAEDRLTGMKGILVDIGMQSSRNRGILEAMALGLGKGLGPEAGQRAAMSIITLMSSRRRDIERNAGLEWGALTDQKTGALNVEAAIGAMEKIKGRITRQTKGKPGLELELYKNLLGDYESAAAIRSTDLRSFIGIGANAGVSTRTASEAQAFRDSDAGQALQRQQEIQRNARTSAERLLSLADAAQGLLASHPLAGGVGLGVAGNLAGKGVGFAWDRAASALLGGSEKAGEAVAAGGLKAGASLSGVAAALPAIAVAAAGAAGIAVGTALDRKFGLSDRIAGVGHDDFTKANAETGDFMSSPLRVHQAVVGEYGLAAKLRAKVRAGTMTPAEAAKQLENYAISAEGAGTAKNLSSDSDLRGRVDRVGHLNATKLIADLRGTKSEKQSMADTDEYLGSLGLLGKAYKGAKAGAGAVSDAFNGAVPTVKATVENIIIEVHHDAATPVVVNAKQTGKTHKN